MCKIRKAQHPFLCVISATALLGMMAVFKTEAVPLCNPGIGDVIGVVGPYGNNYIHIGQTATINALAIFNGSFTNNGAQTICTATNVRTWIVYPNNSFQPVLDLDSDSVLADRVLLPGVSDACPSLPGLCLTFSSTYVVQAADIDQGLTFSSNWPPNLGST